MKKNLLWMLAAFLLCGSMALASCSDKNDNQDNGTPAEDLADYYPEIRKEAGNCRFDDCRHIGEPDCSVKEAVRNGTICRDRYDSYVRIYRELENNRRW